MYVFREGRSTIRYTGGKQFSADASGWFGPSDFSVVSAYTLVKSEFDSFQDWLDHVDIQVDFDVYSEVDSMTKDDLNSTDRFWLVGGNKVYFYITGKRGQHGFFDAQLEDIHYEYGDYYATKLRDKFHDRVNLEDVVDDYIEDTLDYLEDDLSNIDNFVSNYATTGSASEYLYEHESMNELYKIQNEIEHFDYMGSDLSNAIEKNESMLNHAYLLNELKELNSMENTLNDQWVDKRKTKVKSKLTDY